MLMSNHTDWLRAKAKEADHPADKQGLRSAADQIERLSDKMEMLRDFLDLDEEGGTGQHPVPRAIGEIERLRVVLHKVQRERYELEKERDRIRGHGDTLRMGVRLR